MKRVEKALRKHLRKTKTAEIRSHVRSPIRSRVRSWHDRTLDRITTEGHDRNLPERNSEMALSFGREFGPGLDRIQDRILTANQNLTPFTRQALPIFKNTKHTRFPIHLKNNTSLNKA